MELAILIILIVILFFGSEMLIRKLFNIKRVKLADAGARKTSRWGRTLLLIVFLCMIPFAASGDNARNVVYLLFFYNSAMMLLEGYLQWKYIKESKEHIVTFSTFLISIPIWIVILYFYF